MGRPSILTDDLTQRIAALVAEGHYIETVCQSIGIHKDTYYAWLDTAEKQRELDPTTETAHTRFSDAVKVAEAGAEIDLGRKWLEASDKGWLKYATFSSRRFRKHWHDKEMQQHTTYVQQNNYLMPGQVGYSVPQLPAAIEADVVSPPRIEAGSEGTQNC